MPYPLNYTPTPILDVFHIRKENDTFSWATWMFMGKPVGSTHIG